MPDDLTGRKGEKKKIWSRKTVRGKFLPGKREEIKLVLVLPARLHSIPYDNYGLVASDPPANNKSDGDKPAVLEKEMSLSLPNRAGPANEESRCTSHRIQRDSGSPEWQCFLQAPFFVGDRPALSLGWHYYYTVMHHTL